MVAVLVLIGLAVAAWWAVRDRNGLSPGPMFWHEIHRATCWRGLFANRINLGGAVILALGVAYVLATPGHQPNPWILLIGGPLNTRKARVALIGLAGLATILQFGGGGQTQGQRKAGRGSLIEERERGTLSFLLMTDLTEREILFGRPVAKCVIGLFTGATAWPLMAWILGLGLEGSLLLVGFATLLLAHASMLTLTQWVAIRSRDQPHFQRIFGRVILFLFGFPMLLVFACRQPALAAWPGPPPYTLGELSDFINAGNPAALAMRLVLLLTSGGDPNDYLWDALPRWAIFHFGLLALIGFAALGSLRPVSARLMDPPKAKVSWFVTLPRPPVGNWPIFWKSRYLDHPLVRRRFDQWLAWFIALLMLSPLILVGILVWLNKSGADANPLFRGILSCGSLGVLILSGALAAQALLRERRKKTLDELLLTELSAREILGQKALAALCQSRWALAVTAVYLIVGVLVGALHPLAPLALIVLFAVQAAFATAMGIFIAVHAQTVTDWGRPRFWMRWAILLPPVLLVIPVMRDHANPTNQALALFGVGASPGGLGVVLFTAEDLTRGRLTLVAAAGCVVGIVAYSLWAAWLWRTAVRQFPTAVDRRD